MGDAQQDWKRIAPGVYRHERADLNVTRNERGRWIATIQPTNRILADAATLREAQARALHCHAQAILRAHDEALRENEARGRVETYRRRTIVTTLNKVAKRLGDYADGYLDHDDVRGILADVAKELGVDL